MMPTYDAGMNSAPARPRAAIYCRVSLAALGDTTKVDDQLRQCREICARRGWDVPDSAVYTDNSRSAWQRDRKRPAWDRLLADLRAGTYAALASYWGDRIVRQPRDLEDLLDVRDVCDLVVVSVAGQYDFANPEHRMMMRWEVARACNESDTISRRKSAQYERWRREGKVPAGGRPFGYAPGGLAEAAPDRCELSDRKAVGEADIVREMAARVIARESRSAIARDLGARGWATSRGGQWSADAIAELLRRPRYAGLMPDGEAPAAAAAILDRATWERARAALDSTPATNAGAPRAVSHLLSGIARCACGAPVHADRVSSRRGAPRREVYGCRTGCRKVWRNGPQLDAYVIAWTCARLADERNPAAAVPEADAGEWAALHADRAETGLALQTAGRGSAVLLARRLDELDAAIAALRERSSAGERDRLGRQYAGITPAGFRELPLSVQRQLVAGHAKVTVLPASKRGPGFREQDVRVEPAG